MQANTRSGKKDDANRPGALPNKDADVTRTPPDSIPDILPGVDRQQSPGTDRLPAEENPYDRGDEPSP